MKNKTINLTQSIILVTLLFLLVGCQAQKNEALSTCYELYLSGDYENALIEIDKYIEADSQDGNLYALKSIVEFEQKELEKSTNSMNKALELSPTSAFVMSKSGYVQLSQGYLNLALEQLNGALSDENQLKKMLADNQVDIEMYQLYLNLGTTYKSMGNTTEALKAYEAAQKINAEDPDLYNARGLVYKDMNELDKALEQFNEAITLDDRYAYAYGNRGLVFQLQRELDKAISDLITAISIDPLVPQFYYMKAQIEIERDEKDLAIGTLSTVLQKWDDYGEAYFVRGQLYYEANEDLQAIKDFSYAKELKVNEAFLWMGAVYKRMGQLEDAISAYQSYLDLKLDDEETNNQAQLEIQAIKELMK